MRQAQAADPYLRRLAVLAGVVLVIFIVAALLGPESDPTKPWYDHTGVQGEIQIIDAINISQEDDPVDLNALPELEDATRGVDPILTEKVVQPDPENPLPKEEEEGDYGDNMRRVDRNEAHRLVGESPQELRGQSQQSMTFVLLHVVTPEYPDGTAASVRQRQIVVATHLYVDEEGRVAHAYVSRNDGGPAFERAALDAVRQWVYQPLMVDGQPTGFWDSIYFVFRVGSGGEIEIDTERMPPGQSSG
jgi:TonB family protein